MTINRRSREALEANEARLLSPFARLSAEATRRHEEESHGYRTEFQRDRDRIVHSRAFRRLKHKRQVFLTGKGDHYRTRITHTLEVSQIARTIARTLGLNEDLTEAIALGHDLGHTPFGHTGEDILNDIMSGKTNLGGALEALDCGGFKHNYQSLRVVDSLEKTYDFDGLNLTNEAREGILKHTRLRQGKIRFPDFIEEGLNLDHHCCSHLEGQLVAVSDEVAQRTHDLEDGVRAGLVTVEDVRQIEIVRMVEDRAGIAALREVDVYQYRNQLIRGLINLLVDDVIQTALMRLQGRDHQVRIECTAEVVGFSPELDPLQQALNAFIYREIIFNPAANRFDDEAGDMVRGLFAHYITHPEQLPRYALQRFLPNGILPTGPASDCPVRRVVCDYIAGMTDNYAQEEAVRLGVVA